MDKDLVIRNARNKFKGDLLKIVLKQIEDYFELASSSYKPNIKYNVGDNVILNKNHLLHGIGKNTNIINIFAERGIVSQDYFDNNSNHAFCYESAFWSVDKEISLKDFIKNYSGIIAKVNDRYEQVPYGEIDNFVEKIRNVDHWLWTAESSMEIRFMPSLARDINQIGFIVNTENEIAHRMKKNSVFKDTFNKEYALEFLNEKSKDKFIKDGFSEDFFERADYIIFGLPKNCIEGVLVGRLIEKNTDYLNQLKQLFPDCYICNLDGKVIVS